MNCLKAVPDDKENTNPKYIRSYSSSHMDSIGESMHSRQSIESQETWRRIRLQQIFFKSVVQNDLNNVLKCLKHGADVGEEYTPYFQTALHESGRRGLMKMTELLLRSGANPNVIDEKSFLPLHYACQEGHLNTAKCLLIYGSMVTIENDYGDAPIHTATRYGHLDLLPILLQFDLKRDFDRSKVPERYEKQIHIDLQNANGDTCLHIAAALDRKVMVKKLLQWGADPTLVNAQDLTPLQVALSKEKASIVKLLRTPVEPDSFDGVSPTIDVGTATEKNFEGVQRYTDEINRENMNNFDSEPIILKTMSSDNLSQSRSQPSTANFSSMRHIPTAVTPSYSSDPIIAPSPIPRYNPSKIGTKVLPTKIVEIDAQPNNVYNVSNDVSGRLSRLHEQHPNEEEETTTKSIGEQINLIQDTTDSINLEKRIDALSLEVDKKLENLKNQYTELERREEELRKTIEKKSLRKEHKSPRRSTKQEIRVTYQDGHGRDPTIWVTENIKNSQRSNSIINNDDNKVRINLNDNLDNQPHMESQRIINRYEEMIEKSIEVNKEDLEKGKQNQYQDMIKGQKHLEVKSLDNDHHSDYSSSGVEVDRKLNQTYYAPPPPKQPTDNNQWIKNGEVITVVKEVENSNNNLNTKDEEDDFSNTRIYEYKDGKKVICEAPKIRDMYDGRVGRVSPRIKNLQEQLRKSQYKQVYYGLYNDDY